MSDYRLDIKVKNNRLLSAIERAGHSSVLAFCKAYDIKYQHVVGLATMRLPARTKAGHWSKVAQELADALSCNPEDLFTERQAAADFKTTQVRRVVSEGEVLSLASPEAALLTYDGSPDDDLERKELVRQALEALSPRLRSVIEARWLNGGMTVRELADEMNVSSAGAFALEKSALMRMRMCLKKKYRVSSSSRN